ncbi:MAG TPA: hypothetical protein VNT99_13055 [Methylomirabilota bacterium]|nr:hypothetical protein [Methylomirabilota bacterium]
MRGKVTIGCGLVPAVVVAGVGFWLFCAVRLEWKGAVPPGFDSVSVTVVPAETGSDTVGAERILEKTISPATAAQSATSKMTVFRDMTLWQQ